MQVIGGADYTFSTLVFCPDSAALPRAEFDQPPVFRLFFRTMPTPTSHAKPPHQPPQKTVSQLTFALAVDELERIVRTMESGQQDELDLEGAIAAYQRGMELLRHCQSLLSLAEQRIQVLEPEQDAPA